MGLTFQKSIYEDTKPVDFLTPLHFQVLDDKSYLLLDEWLVSVYGVLVAVPQFFKTDLASVPRLPFIYLVVGGVGVKASVLHDYLYATGLVSREDADEIFYQALIEDGLSVWRAKMMWTGVRVGGASHYNNEAREAFLARQKALKEKQHD